MVVLAGAGAVTGVGPGGGLAAESFSLSASAVAPPVGVQLAQAAPGTAAPAAAQPNVAAGQTAFLLQCGVCHTTEAGGPNRVGPNLSGIVGRQAATSPGFAYSDAFKKAATWKWDAALLGGWISNPGALIPGNAMAVFQGVADKDRDNIIAFLATLK
jgi:cytochrome c